MGDLPRRLFFPSLPLALLSCVLVETPGKWLGPEFLRLWSTFFLPPPPYFCWIRLLQLGSNWHLPCPSFTSRSPAPSRSPFPLPIFNPFFIYPFFTRNRFFSALCVLTFTDKLSPFPRKDRAPLNLFFLHANFCPPFFELLFSPLFRGPYPGTTRIAFLSLLWALCCFLRLPDKYRFLLSR